MIDLHIHLLPELDDGASCLEEAVDMCRLCVEEGIHTVVATPHIIGEVFENRRETILQALDELKDELSRTGVPLKVLPGSDVRMDFDLIERIDRQEICTMNDGNRYVLIEFPETPVTRNHVRILSALKRRGLRPILSHPERNPFFREEVDTLYELAYSDVYMQITARSLLGGFGGDAKRFSEDLLRHRLVHIIASDAHSSVTRPPGLLKAVQRAAEFIGDEEAKKLVQDNPRLMIEGKTPTVPSPLPWGKKKTFWSRIFS